MGNTEHLPSLPKITIKIRKAVRDKATTWFQLANLIREDPGLSAQLLKYSSSPIFRTTTGTPKTVQEIISRMGMSVVDNLIMTHSIKSMFVIKHPVLLKEFKLIWKRQILKAGISSFLAHQLKYHSPDEAVLASLLTEVGSLAILMAFENLEIVPDTEMYVLLCREYSKRLAAVLLAKWSIDEHFVKIVKMNGEWEYKTEGHASLIDIINLSTYHTATWNSRPENLPPLSALWSYQKLFPPLNEISDTGSLKIIADHKSAINEIVNSLG